MLDISLCISHDGFSAAFFLFGCLVLFLFVFSSMIYFMFLYFYLPLFAILFFVFCLWRRWRRVLEFWTTFLWSPVFIRLFFVLFFPLRNLCRMPPLFNIVHGKTLYWKSMLLRYSWMRFFATRCGVVGSDHQCRWQVGCLDFALRFAVDYCMVSSLLSFFGSELRILNYLVPKKMPAVFCYRFALWYFSAL